MGTSKYTIFGLFVAIYFFFAACKPWLDMYMGISHQLVTGFQLVLCLFVIFLFISKVLFIDVLTFFFAIYVLSRFFTELVVLSFVEFPVLEAVGAGYSVIRFIMFCGLVLVITHYNKPESASGLKNIVLGYFLITLLYSLLQHPMIGNIPSLAIAGGNIVSGNGLGVFRANGGVGGTVIAYANFLLAVSWIIFYSHFTNKRYQSFLKVCLLVSLLLCFSRSAFLCLFSMYLAYSFFEKKFTRLFFLTIILLSLIYYQGEFIMENYLLMISDSDSDRVGGWVIILGDNSILELVMGSQVGQNTGLFLGELTKNGGGDSFLIGTLNDFGLFGLVIFLSVISRLVMTSSNLTYSTKFGILISFFLMTFVNSGFEKLLVMLSYFLALLIIRNNPAQKIGQTATQKTIFSN